MYIEMTYHESIGQELDATVAKRGSGELKIAKVTCKNSCGQRHEIVDHVNKHSRGGEAEEQLEFDPCGQTEALDSR